MSTTPEKSILVTFLPSHKKVSLQPGKSILDAAKHLGLPIHANCSGTGTCGKCKIVLRQGDLPITAADLELLSEKELMQGIRLACMAVPDNDCTVAIVENAAERGGEILIQGLHRHVAIEPAVKRFSVTVPQPTLTGGGSDADLLLATLPADLEPLSLRLLQQLADKLRESHWNCQAVLFENRLLDVLPGSLDAKLGGLAIDIGTTTVVVKLIDLESGEILATSAQFNAQRKYGDDVIARINSANDLGTAALQQTLIAQLNDMIEEVLLQAHLPAERLFQLVVAGNTAMQHFLCGLPPRHLAQMPYVPVVRRYPLLTASELGLQAHPAAPVLLMPGLGRFVGGDTAAVLLTLAPRLEETWLAVDIGTNGELLLCHRGRLWTTSAAAGPAFEGAHIASGMRAVDGAIDRVYYDGGVLSSHVMGEGRAQGICGSGLIDAVAALLQAGVVDYSGRMHIPGGRVVLRDEVALTQGDIREVQLAKGAIATAIALLLREAGLRPDELESLYLAGAFGQYIRKEMALRIGLLPGVAPEKIHFIGNAACAGAELALMNRAEWKQIERLSQQVEYVEVAAQSSFQDLFAENMFFPLP